MSSSKDELPLRFPTEFMDRNVSTSGLCSCPRFALQLLHVKKDGLVKKKDVSNFKAECSEKRMVETFQKITLY